MAKKADDKAKKETAKKPAKETKAKKANKKSKVSGSASADDDIPVTQETVKSAKRLPFGTKNAGIKTANDILLHEGAHRWNEQGKPDGVCEKTRGY